MKLSPAVPLPTLPVVWEQQSLPLMMGMMVSCSRVFSGACSENSCGKGAGVSIAAELAARAGRAGSGDPEWTASPQSTPRCGCM